MTLQVGARAGDLVQRRLQWPLAAESGATSLHCVERGQSSLEIALGSEVASATGSEAWKTLFPSGWIFTELERNREEAGSGEA